MTFPEPKMKSVFYSTNTVIEGAEKRKIIKAETYKRKKDDKMELIRKAIKELNTTGGKVTQKSVSAVWDSGYYDKETLEGYLKRYQSRFNSEVYT